MADQQGVINRGCAAHSGRSGKWIVCLIRGYCNVRPKQ
jgi:hypothetical protein